jgi:hypothetical protein
MSRLYLNIRLIVLLLIFSSVKVTSQNTDVMIDLGIKSFEKGSYFEANHLFSNALKVDSSKLKLQFYHGLNLMKIHNYKKSQYFLNNVVKKDPSGKIYPQANYYLGELLKYNGQYKEAIFQFKKTKAHYVHDITNFFYKKSAREINSCIYAMRHKELMNDAITLQPMSGNVNGYNADFGGIEDNGKLYFTSVKDSTHAQIYVKKENDNVEKFDSIIDDDHFHNANGLFIKDHRYFLFTRCDSLGHCKIMLSKKENNNWTEAVDFSDEINSSGHNITQPFFTKINGRNILLFCSDNKKGYGKLDIWYAEILDDLSVANINNAGPYVNSIENDITPFYHQPSNRLYFSSTWHNGYGGYDVFFSHWNDSIFEMPKNAEKPINSSWNDLYFWINDYGKHGYVTTNRDGSLYDSIPNCCPDIWEFTAKKPIVEKEIFLSELNSKEYFKHKTGLTLPLALYFHNDEPLPNSLDTVVSETYPQTFEKYVALQPLYLKSYAIGNNIEMKKLAREQIDYFFDEYVNDGLKKLEKFKNQLLPLLDEYNQIEITIKGFASPLAKNDYNTNLSKRRISSLINYFETVDNGSLIPYLSSGKLTLKSAPYGEKKSSDAASDDLNNKKESIYSPKAAIERRIEIQEVIFKEN